MRRGAGAVVAASLAASAGLGMLVLAAMPAQAVFAPGPLAGTFGITAGRCSTIPATAPSGSYFFMQPGSRTGFVSNTSSPCSGGDYTPVAPGTDGGLATGAYQLDPIPTFNGGNSLAGRIIQPVAFFSTAFGLATTCADQQNAPTSDGSCPASASAQFPNYPAPSLADQACTTNGLPGFCLYGDLRALGATWNGASSTCAGPPAGVGCYDQGAAVDAGGAVTCDTGASGCGLSGTFDPTTGAYSLTLVAPIHGGAFNGFIGNWYLTGTFTPGTGPSGSPPANSGGPPAPGTAPAVQQAPATSAPSGPSRLVGLLTISSGGCTSGIPTGSYFAMTKGGGPVKNATPNCADGTYNLLTQGATGLKLGAFQPNPTPTFDSSGNALAADIVRPVAFFGTNFSLATSPQDEQNAPNGPARFPAPTASLSGSAISADLSAVTATWNGPAGGTCSSGPSGGNGCYDQGSNAASGTFDQQTHAYTLDWSATIVGGAFNGATGHWHLAGTFQGQIVAGGRLGFPASGTPPGDSLLRVVLAIAGAVVVVTGAAGWWMSKRRWT